MFDDETIHALIIPDPREVYGFNAPPVEPLEEEDEDEDYNWNDPWGDWDDEDDEEEEGEKF